MSTSNLANSAAPAGPPSIDASRRDFLKSAAAGAFILGTYVAFPGIAGAQGEENILVVFHI